MASKKSVFNLVYIALFAALTAVCVVISVPLPFTAVPISLLVLGVLITGGLLEKKQALTAQLIYLLLGIVGLPVFAGFKSGIGTLLGPTGGYLMASPLMAFIVAWVIELAHGKRNILWLSAGMAAAELLCWTFGTIWFCVTTGDTFATGFFKCVVPFLVPDVLKLVVAELVVIPTSVAYHKLSTAQG